MEENTKTGRRKFLVKASAGALISTIPAKSVWATGLTNSIVASGHGSDMGGNKLTNLKPVSFWQTYPGEMGHYENMPFIDLFGHNPFVEDWGQRLDISTKPTLKEVLTVQEQGVYIYAGPNNINWNMIAVVMNAHRDGAHSIHYPIAGPGKPFPDVKTLAMHINSKFTGTATGYSTQLEYVLNHQG